ncbi:MAG: OmpA family protein [bacterium]|nr:OmpA family protein [bacterium]MBU1918890.1 OmpA family protein [bacterium]
MQKQKKSTALLVCLFGIMVLTMLLGSTSAFALNVQNFQPSQLYSNGLQLHTSDALKKWDMSLGFATNYVHNPLEVGRIGAAARTQGLVDQLLTTDFLVSVGLTDWWTLNLDVPVNWYHNIAPGIIATRDKGGPEFGDIRFSSKFTLYNASKTKHGWGLAFIPYVTAPTGDQNVFVGYANATGGAILAVDKIIKSNRFYVNTGIRFNDETLQNIDIQHEFVFGVGYQRPLIKKADLDIILEMTGSTTFNNFFTDEVTTPLDFHLALKKAFLKNKNLVAYVGGSRGITGGYGSPDFRVFTGLSYTFSIKPRAKFLPGIVYFRFDKSVLDNPYEPIVDRIASYYVRHKKTHFTVHGHTDAVGPNAYNYKLAKKRAESVKKELIQRGVPGAHIKVLIHGEEKPVATNKTIQGRALNRRAETDLYVSALAN